MPFLSLTDEDLDQASTDPVEFINAIDDICGDQKSKTLKVRTAIMLESLCDNCHELYPFVVNFCTDVVTKSCQDLRANQSEGEQESAVFTHPDISNMIKTFNLHFRRVSDFADVCLLVLTATSHL